MVRVGAYRRQTGLFTTKDFDKLLTRTKGYGKKHAGFTVLYRGPAFDCYDAKSMQQFVDWAKSKGARNHVYLLSVTHNICGRPFEELRKIGKKLAKQLQKGTEIGMANAWGVGGWRYPGGFCLDLSVAYFDTPEESIHNIARVGRGGKFWDGQVPQIYLTKVNIWTGECQYEEVR